MPNTSTKTKIATLFRQLRYFTFDQSDGPTSGQFLVNQKALQEDGQLEPSRDDLLRKIGEASGEMMEFMRSNDQSQDAIGQMTTLLSKLGDMMTRTLGLENS